MPEGAEGAAPGDQPREAHGPRLRRHVVRQWWPVATGIVIGVTAAWALWPSPPPPPQPTTTQSIAVLPFRVIGADRDQTSFTEGLSEDLITALAEHTGLHVVSGALSADGAKATRDVGRELNALYVLDGSVRTEGNKVRVSAQLVASDTGFHLWGGRYDRLLGDVLALQDDVSARIVKTLAAKLIEAEGERRQMTVGEPIAAGGFLIAGLEYLGRVAEQAVVIPGELFRRVFGEERGWDAMQTARHRRTRETMEKPDAARTGILGPRRCILAIGLAIACAVAATDASAQEFGKEVVSSGTIADNLVVGGRRVVVRAQVAGDVVAFGEWLNIGDDIRDDVLAAGRRVGINGTIGGDVRLAGARVNIGAAVAGDAMAAGARIEVKPSARIAGQAWLAGADVRIGGKVGGKLRAAGRTVTIGGEIGDDVIVHARSIHIVASAKIDGDLTYHSDQEAEIHPDAQIAGDVTFIRSEGPRHFMGRTFAALGAIGIAVHVGAILVGVIIVLLFPSFTAAAARTIPRAPWKASGLGFALLVSTPVAMVILVSSLIGLPLTFVVLNVYLIGLVFAYFITSLAVGRGIARLVRASPEVARRGRRIALLVVGGVVLGVVAFVPVVGALTLLAALSLGLGALTLELWRLCIAPRAS